MSSSRNIYRYENNFTSNLYYPTKKLHRVDGPAIEDINGYKEWWVDDEEYTEQEFNQIIKEVNEMSVAMKLTDPREWVRELGKKEVV